jgi:hypothetical protein
MTTEQQHTITPPPELEKNMSPAAQAVTVAYANAIKAEPHGRWCENAIAAALRAAADQMASYHSKKFLYSIADCWKLREIANELESHQ